MTGISALRAQKTGHTTFEYIAVVHEVAKALLQYPEVNEAAKVWQEYQTGYSTNPAGNEHPDNKKLLSAVWSLIGEGILYPRLNSYSQDGHPHPIDKVVLTARGERVIAGGDQHPLHPGFMRASPEEQGLRAEQIRERLGLQVKEMPRILKAGLSAPKVLTSKGRKRATTYFPK